MVFNLIYIYIVSENGIIESENTTRQIDPAKPGVIIASKNVNVTGIFGQVSIEKVVANSVITYTDYDNVQLRVSCSNVNNFWVGTQFLYYFVLVRDRNFDSIKFLRPVIENLIKIGIHNFENLVLLNNSASCIN